MDGQYCGNPLLFTQEAPLFYPLTVPLLSTGAPAHRLADLFTLFHFWMAGFLAYLLLRDLDCSPAAALFGGVAWMLSARMIQSAIWPNAVAVMALLPALLLGVLRIARGRRRSGVVWTAVAGALCLLAARPQVLMGAVPLLIVVGGTAIYLSQRRLTTVQDLSLAGLIAFALGAPSLLPAAVLQPETSRAGGLARSARDLWALTFSGDLDQVFLPVDGGDRWPEAAAYPGVLAGFLFLWGVVSAIRRRDSLLPRGLLLGLAAGGALGLLFAFGEKGPLGLVADLPLIRGFRIPARYLVSWSLAVVLGSALALSALLARARRPALLAAVCVIGLGADLTLNARRAAPTAPSAVYSVEPALVATVRASLGKDEAGFPRRFWSLGEPLFLWLHADEQKDAHTERFEPLYGALGMMHGLEAVSGAGPSLSRWKNTFRSVNRRAAELAGVGAFVLPAPGSPPPSPGSPRPMVVQRFAGIPRAILVSEAIVVPRARAIEATLDPELDPRHTAVLEEGSPLPASPGSVARNPAVRLLSRGPGRATLATSSSAEGILVVFQTYERGWRATVDGAPARVMPADGAFQGIRLPPGRHVVELRYRPPGLAAGLVAAAVGIVGLALAARRLPEQNRTNARPTVEKE